MSSCFSGFDGPGNLNRVAEQQQLFGHGRFSSIRVRDDGKRASLIDFIDKAAITHITRTLVCT